MSQITPETHPAIAAITAEEDTWRVESIFSSRPRLSCIGLDEDGMYYERVLPGTDDEGRLGELDFVTPTEIPPHEALARRYNHDRQWQARPVLRPYLEELYRHDFFERDGKRNLVGSIASVALSSGLATERTLCIRSDGSIEVKIEPEKRLKNPFIWHRYILPRGTGRAYHDVKRQGVGHTDRAEVINPADIISAVKTQVKIIGNDFQRQRTDVVFEANLPIAL